MTIRKTSSSSKNHHAKQEQGTSQISSAQQKPTVHKAQSLGLLTKNPFQPRGPMSNGGRLNPRGGNGRGGINSVRSSNSRRSGSNDVTNTAESGSNTRTSASSNIENAESVNNSNTDSTQNKNRLTTAPQNQPQTALLELTLRNKDKLDPKAVEKVITPMKNLPGGGTEYAGSMAFGPKTKKLIESRLINQGMVIDDGFGEGEIIYHNKDETIAGSYWPTESGDDEPHDRITYQTRTNFDGVPPHLEPEDDAYVLTEDGNFNDRFPDSMKGTVETTDFQVEPDGSGRIVRKVDSHLPLEDIPPKQLNVEDHIANLSDSKKEELYPELGILAKQSPTDIKEKGWTMRGEDGRFPMAWYKAGAVEQAIKWAQGEDGTYHTTSVESVRLDKYGNPDRSVYLRLDDEWALLKLYEKYSQPGSSSTPE